MPIALPALGGLVLVLWVIAIALIIAVILGYVADIFHGLPWPLDQLAGPVNSLASGISNVCWKAIRLTERAVGVSFHWLANYADKVWDTITTGASIDAQTARVTGSLIHTYKAVSGKLDSVARDGAAVAPRVKALEREYKGLEAGIKQLEREYHGIDETGLHKQVTTLEHELAKLENQTVPAIQHTADGAASDVATVEGFLGIHPNLSWLKWAGGVVAAGLAAVGLSGLTCSENPLRNQGCDSSVWSGLSKLLGLVGLLAIGFSFQEFVDDAETVAGYIGDAVATLEQPFLEPLPPLPPPTG